MRLKIFSLSTLASMLILYAIPSIKRCSAKMMNIWKGICSFEAFLKGAAAVVLHNILIENEKK